MLLRRKHGGTGVGPYSWPEDDSVCEVPDVLGRDLLGLDPGEYSVAEPDEDAEPAAKAKRASRSKPAATEAPSE